MEFARTSSGLFAWCFEEEIKEEGLEQLTLGVPLLSPCLSHSYPDAFFNALPRR